MFVPHREIPRTLINELGPTGETKITQNICAKFQRIEHILQTSYVVVSCKMKQNLAEISLKRSCQFFPIAYMQVL